MRGATSLLLESPRPRFRGTIARGIRPMLGELYGLAGAADAGGAAAGADLGTAGAVLLEVAGAIVDVPGEAEAAAGIAGGTESAASGAALGATNERAATWP